jgi:hypothetical protein
MCGRSRPQGPPETSSGGLRVSGFSGTRRNFGLELPVVPRRESARTSTQAEKTRTQFTWRSLRALGFASLLGASVASAQQTAYNADRDGLGLKGYDPVSYFTGDAPAKGKATFSATHDGVTYRFASAEGGAVPPGWTLDERDDRPAPHPGRETTGSPAISGRDARDGGSAHAPRRRGPVVGPVPATGWRPRQTAAAEPRSHQRMQRP